MGSGGGGAGRIDVDGGTGRFDIFIYLKGIN